MSDLDSEVYTVPHKGPGIQYGRDSHIYTVPTKQPDIQDPKATVRKLKILVCVLFAVVLVIGSVATVVVLGLSNKSTKDDEASGYNQQQTGACNRNPCLNGGTCTDIPPNNFICSCAYPFFSNTCSEKQPPTPRETACSSDPCLNGGTCTNLPTNDYICQCMSPYYGENCAEQEPVDPCLSSPCNNRGTCVKLPSGSYICLCDGSYYGNNCNQRREILTVIGCEDNVLTTVPPVMVSCAGGKLIDVIYANYGRTKPESQICPYAPHVAEHENTGCSAAGSDTKIKSFCNGKASCKFTASNGVFGDPCIGTYKYVEVQYMCI